MKKATVTAMLALLIMGGVCAKEESAANFQDLIPSQEVAINKGLAWLAKHQAKDGSWGNQGSSGNYRMAMTGLAGLAFLSAGTVPGRGQNSNSVTQAMKCILKAQERDGLITSATEGQSMYGHGFALTFMSQVYGVDLRGEDSPKIKECLNKGVNLIARAQSSLGGWYYSPNSGMDEGSVTITQVQALRGCANVGITIPPRVMRNALSYMHKSQNSDGGIRYSAQGGGSSTLALSAAGGELLLMAGEYDSPQTQKVLDYLKKNLKVNITHNYHQYYTNYYGAQVMMQIGGKYWEQYFGDLRKQLLSSQLGDGSWSGDIGSTYCTAIAVTILALPYQYLPIFQK